MSGKNIILNEFNEELEMTNMILKEKVIPVWDQSMTEHTYAQIADISNVSTKRNVPCIMIKPKQNEKLQELWKAVTNEQNTKSNIQINNIRITKQTIAIRCINANSNKKSKNVLQMAKNIQAEVSIETMYNPQIKIFGIDLDEYFDEKSTI